MLDSKQLLAYLTRATKLVAVEHSASFTQAKASQSTTTATVTKTGYWPVGIIGWRLGGTGVGQIVPYSCYISARSLGSATVIFGTRNNNTTTDVSGTFNFSILWQKR